MPYEPNSEEVRKLLNPFGACQVAVIEKATGRILECIHFFESRFDNPNGKWSTIGHVGFIQVDSNIHELRKAAKEELEACFEKEVTGH